MDMKSMMKQAQKLQAQMEQAKKEIDESTFVSVQGNVVTVEMYGTKNVSKIEIDDSVMDDKEMVQDLIMVAVNDCVKQIDEYTNEKMGALSPNLGGLF